MSFKGKFAVLIVLINFIFDVQCQLQELVTFDRRFGFNVSDSDYKRCEERRSAAANSQFKRTGVRFNALFHFERADVSMDCPTCVHPTSVADFTWQFSLDNNNYTEVTNLNSSSQTNARINKNWSLIIGSANMSNIGYYRCTAFDLTIIVYHLDVSGTEPTRSIFANNFDPVHNVHILRLALPDNNLALFTVWMRTSECSKCRAVGFRKRVGMCYVSKMTQSLPTRPRDIENFDRFARIPCRSRLLPQLFKSLPAIAQRRSVVEFSFCNNSCITENLINVTDADGNVIDRFNSARGQFSFLNDFPALRERAQRAFTIVPIGNATTLNCLSTPYLPIYWTIGRERPINRFRAHNFTNGRMSINNKNQLTIRNLNLNDQNWYTCWYQERIVSIARLVVRVPNDNGSLFLIFVQNIGSWYMLIVVIILVLSINRNRKYLANKVF